MELTEFKYEIDKLEVDFYGDAKIDVFEDDELILEIDKVDDSIWVIQTSRIEESLVTIREEIKDQLLTFISFKVKEKFGTDLPVMLHPNFFLTINKSNLN